MKGLVRKCSAGSYLIHFSQNSIHSALLARVQDTHQGVMDALYSERIIFPFLLYSKPRQRTADVVWDIISSFPHSPGNNPDIHEWIIGCASIVKAEKEKAGSDGIETMVRLNLALSCQIARE